MSIHGLPKITGVYDIGSWRGGGWNKITTSKIRINSNVSLFHYDRHITISPPRSTHQFPFCVSSYMLFLVTKPVNCSQICCTDYMLGNQFCFQHLSLPGIDVNIVLSTVFTAERGGEILSNIGLKRFSSFCLVTELQIS